MTLPEVPDESYGYVTFCSSPLYIGSEVPWGNMIHIDFITQIIKCFLKLQNTQGSLLILKFNLNLKHILFSKSIEYFMDKK